MPKNFSGRLEQLCGTDNMSRISKATGVPYTTIKNYFDGSGRLPGGDILVQIYESTGVNITWLLTGEGEMYYKDQVDFGEGEDLDLGVASEQGGSSSSSGGSSSIEVDLSDLVGSKVGGGELTGKLGNLKRVKEISIEVSPVKLSITFDNSQTGENIEGEDLLDNLTVIGEHIDDKTHHNIPLYKSGKSK